MLFCLTGMFAMFSTPIRAIAFDLDGTLVDSLTDIAAAANAARAELGLAPLTDAGCAALSAMARPC